METKPVKTIPLHNGLTLEIYDESREIAAKRWVVRMVARIVIPIDNIAFAQGQNVSEITDLLGKTIVFEKKKERNFIAEKEKDAVLTATCDSFLETAGAYLSHSDFPRKFVFKQYRDRTAKMKWTR